MSMGQSWATIPGRSNAHSLSCRGSGTAMQQHRPATDHAIMSASVPHAYASSQMIIAATTATAAYTAISRTRSKGTRLELPAGPIRVDDTLSLILRGFTYLSTKDSRRAIRHDNRMGGRFPTATRFEINNIRKGMREPTLCEQQLSLIPVNVKVKGRGSAWLGSSYGPMAATGYTSSTSCRRSHSGAIWRYTWCSSSCHRSAIVARPRSHQGRP